MHLINRDRSRIYLTIRSMLFVACALGASNLIAGDVLEAKGDLQWYRGNTHTHSHWSDGNDYLPNIGLWYRDHGYQFLLFTDHNVLANTERWVNVKKTKGGEIAYKKLKKNFPDHIDERQDEAGETEVRLHTFEEVSKLLSVPGKYLLIQGEEISDSFKKLPIHMNAHNVKEQVPPSGGSSVTETIQNNIRAIESQRERTGQPMIIHLNHPNFHYAITAEDIIPVIGERFFEVYNGHRGVHNKGDHQHASTERIWDIVLTVRLDQLNLPILFGMGTDDGHDYHTIPNGGSNPGRGWVMVLADELTPEALIKSMEAGKFYASSGVTLKRVETSDKDYTVEIEPTIGETYTIEFIGTRKGYDKSSEPVKDKNGKEVRATRIYSDDVGTVLAKVEGTKATYTFKGDEIYVRARVTSSKLHPNYSEEHDHIQAWCQPVVGPGHTGK